MAKEENNKTARLKLIHLLYIIIIAAASVGVAWGVLANQQGVNSAEIEKKLDRELFDMHQTQQTQQFESLQATMKEGFGRMDKRLERIESK